MRATSLLRTLLALQDTVVTGSELTPEALIVDVKPTWRIGRCSECHRKAPTYDRRRVKCRRCGIKVEAVPWAEAGSRFTRPFEMHTTYLAKGTDKTTVTKLSMSPSSSITRVASSCGLPDVGVCLG